MYARYKRTRIGENSTHYEIIKKDINIFGCNKGHILRLLKSKIPPHQDEPYYWHVDVSCRA